MPVRALSIHADYRCHNSGVCCRSRFEIPVERDAERRIRAGIDEGRLRPAADWARPVAGLPHGARVVLRVRADGDCVFLETGERRLCAVQRRLGEDAMPPACRQFPRVATLTPDGVSLTLSHYCPTAAALLFRDELPLAVVSDPPAFPPSWPYEGLDARDALPPLLRPGVLMSWAAHARLEQHAVAVLGREELAPEHALARLEAEAEALRAWTPALGRFDEHVTRVIDASAAAGAPATRPLESSLESWLAAWERVAAVVPPGHPLPASPRRALEAAGGLAPGRVAPLVELACRELRRPLGRWLAARAFASWLPLQGDGVRTSLQGLRLAHRVLLAELARAVAEPRGEAVDKEQLKQAIRRADLLLVQLADPQALARELGRCEARA